MTKTTKQGFQTFSMQNYSIKKNKKMKKYCLTVCTIASLSLGYAQESPKEHSNAQKSLQAQLEQLQRQMQQMFPGMLDSTMKNMPNLSFDSMMKPLSRSFEFFNDGKGWQQMLPDSSKTNDMLQNMEGYMNFFKSDKDFPNLLEQFEGMMNGLPNQIPRSESNQRKQRGDAPKDKKYKTDSL
ncbi:MAG: hypothetical protein RLZZ628_2796 [Bacteroidota bacterium]|jgi:hypothetical protein